MLTEQLPPLQINGLTVQKPIIQGGMGVGISLAGLASAVADAGGMGVISSVGIGFLKHGSQHFVRGLNAKVLREEIRLARSRTSGVLGVNIMVAITDFEDQLEAAFQEEIDVVIMGAGLPLKMPKSIDLKTAHTRTAVIVSSGRAAGLIFRQWAKNFNHVPDMVIVEGPLAGGHLGFKREQIEDPAFALENLIPDVLKAVEPYQWKFDKDIPVIAAGGIWDGADIRRFLEMGAAGVQMGTRFVTTQECDASQTFKSTYIEAQPDDITLIQSPVGLPGRAIRNHFLDEVSAGVRKPMSCPWHCLKTCNVTTSPYCIAHALMNAQLGNMAEGYAFAGANAWKAREIVSVDTLFKALAQEFYKSHEMAVMEPALT